MAIVIRYMCCLVFISRSSDLIQYGGIVTKAIKVGPMSLPTCGSDAYEDCQINDLQLALHNTFPLAYVHVRWYR